MILRVGGNYVPLYNVREMYFGDSSETTFYIVRNTISEDFMDIEKHELSEIDARWLKKELTNKAMR